MDRGKTQGRQVTHRVRPPAGRMRPALLSALAALALAALATGCKQDCAGPAKLGDFEFSQGNYVNAVKQYEKALRADPKCYQIEEKLEEARRKASVSH